MENFSKDDLDLMDHGRSANRVEIEPSPESLPERPRFNWAALFVMLISIGVALAVGIFIPGLLDEYIAIIIINVIYGFVQANGFRTPKK